MTQINPKINSTQAGQIAKQLDIKDGNKDGKVAASIWNEFVADKGGKEIKYSITLENAMKSISTYLYKNATKAGATVKNLAATWLNKEIEANKTTNKTSVNGANGTSSTNTNQKAKNSLPLKVEYPQVPLKGPNMRGIDYIELNSMHGKGILGHKASGKNVANFIRPFLEDKSLDANYMQGDANACIAKINKNNVAYVVQNLGDLLFESEESAEINNTIIRCLLSKARELGNENPNFTDTTTSIIASKDNQKMIKELAQAIIENNESEINEMNAFQSIRTPNPELANKTILDKVTNYEYTYDENGTISTICSVLKSGNKEAKFTKVTDYTGEYSFADHRSNPSYILDKEGNIIESTLETGNKEIKYNSDGSVKMFIEDRETGEFRYFVDEVTGEITNSIEYCFRNNTKGIDSISYDNKGNFKFYSEQHENKFVYKDLDGKTFKSIDMSSNPVKYFDANGNEISSEEWGKLEPTESK